MRFNGKNILSALAAALGTLALSLELSNFPDVSYLRALIYLACVFYIPIQSYETKRKITDFKRKYNLEGNYTLEEIEKLRIEMDYQETFVKKLNLK